MNDGWFVETLHHGFGQRFQVNKLLFHTKSDFQDVMIFENVRFGTMLTLDGVVQVTTADEYVYHEMMTHVPLLAHPAPRNMLIIGGGDGGILREALRHPDLNVTMVELDPSVVELCREHMPTISNGAFDNPRANLVFADGAKFVAETADRFDVIVVDSSDPSMDGNDSLPASVLYTEEFYSNCKRCLTPGGILVTQNGVPFHQASELKASVGVFRKLFNDAGCYLAVVPTYYGGFMSLGYASDDLGNRLRPIEDISRKFAAINITTKYYTPEVHKAAFALPAFVQKLIA